MKVETGSSGCLQQMGEPFIDRYDKLPKTIRERIASSPFQLCPACVLVRYQRARDRFSQEYRYKHKRRASAGLKQRYAVDMVLNEYIPYMERTIRKTIAKESGNV